MKNAIAAITLCLGASFAMASPDASRKLVILQCEGEESAFPNGFGKNVVRVAGARIIQIDLDARTVKMAGIFGDRVSSLKASRDTSFVFDFPLNERYGGALVKREFGSIERYTGKMHATYELDPQPADSIGYSAFSGTCKKAEKLF